MKENDHNRKSDEKEGKRKHYPDEIKTAARGLYLRRYKAPEIADMLGVPVRTLYYWIQLGAWDDMLAHEGAEEAANRRLALVLGKDDKTQADLKEMDSIISTLERLQRLRLREKGEKSTSQTSEGAEDGKENPFAGETRQKKPRKAEKKKNDVSSLTESLFAEKLHGKYFAYQRAMRDLKDERIRMYLKARQIGATWYFAQEAFEDAVFTGRNQIFLSATKAQSQMFREYIIQCAGEAFDIELKGNPIVLHTAHGPATLYFLATSSRSAQTFHGNVYMDEFFWIPKFAEFNKVASAMAAHKKWHLTYFSTPSIITHQAYPLWSGDTYLSGQKNPPPWPAFDLLQAGRMCPDRRYRQIITLDDAERGGCDLFDREDLEHQYEPAIFRQLFGCEFIDDAASVFAMGDLERCMEDSAAWKNVDFSSSRPVGDAVVWGGYDPSRVRDDASFVVLLPPQKAGDKIRLLERHTWKDKSYLWQVDQIKGICDRYRFGHVGVDITGPGVGVYENMKLFCPVAKPLTYSVASKTALVLKGQEVIGQRRFAYDASQTDISRAFMTIKQVATGHGGVTYAASRTDTTGHADVAWATLHAFEAEPLARQYQDGGRKSSISFSN